MKVHFIFHVSLLKLYQVNELLDRVQAPLPSVVIVTEEGEAEEHEVELILRMWLFYRNLQYLVQWKRYTDSESVQWCSPDDVKNTAELMNQFHQNHPDMPQRDIRKKRSKQNSWLSFILIISSCLREALKESELLTVLFNPEYLKLVYSI